MNEMYSAYITEVDEYLKGNLAKSLEFIDWKKHVYNAANMLKKHKVS